MKFSIRIKRVLFILGLLLIAICIGAYLHRAILTRAELKQFRDVRAVLPVDNAAVFPPSARFKLDVSKWSQRRFSEYVQSLRKHVDPPFALLRICRLGLEVPVLEGTDGFVLNRGVGQIVGTKHPGEDGMIRIVGHRDGFFRVFKFVTLGDTIELATPKRIGTYVVDQIVLVRPDDASVRRPRSRRSLTLRNCYPFYFVRSAPQRYIVYASISNLPSPNLGMEACVKTLNLSGQSTGRIRDTTTARPRLYGLSKSAEEEGIPHWYG